MSCGVEQCILRVCVYRCSLARSAHTDIELLTRRYWKTRRRFADEHAVYSARLTTVARLHVPKSYVTKILRNPPAVGKDDVALGIEFLHREYRAVVEPMLAVRCRAVLAGGVGLFLMILPMPAAAQPSSTGQTLQSPPPDEHRVADTMKFLAGAALGLGMHEGGHLVLDTVFDASPRIEGVRFGPFPFFAITHRADVSPRREFAISSAGNIAGIIVTTFQLIPNIGTRAITGGFAAFLVVSGLVSVAARLSRRPTG